MGRMVLRPLDNPTTGILVDDLEIEEVSRTVYMVVKYFKLTDEEDASPSEEDHINIPYTDFLSSFDICVNWEDIDYISDAEWESLKNVELQMVNKDD